MVAGEFWYLLFCFQGMFLTRHIALDTRYHGPVNAVSPNPVRYKDFATTLGKTLHRPAFFPTPAFILKLALGEAAALALNSYHIVPTKLVQTYGFEFKFIHLSAALENLFGKS